MDLTVEIGDLQLRLAEGLQCHLRDQHSEVSYVMHDRVSGRHFRVGLTEYAFISLLDGNTTLRAALERLATSRSRVELNAERALAICHWLVQSGLAAIVAEDSDARERAKRLLERANDDRQRHRLRNANPLFVRIPIANPVRLFQWCNRWTRWLAQPITLCFMAASACLVLMQLPEHAHRLARSAMDIVAPANWLWLTLSVAGLKVLHEAAHGIVAARFGVPPKGFGCVLILFVPIPYLDVSDSWTLSSRWARIAIAAAGMIVELFVASVALWFWMLTRDPLIQQHLLNLVVAASVTTVVFNANFLMRFDGYYIVSDWLGVPNLASSANQYFRYLCSKYLFGLRVTIPAPCRRLRPFLFGYAILATVWRIAVCATLALAAGAMFQGFGLLLAILAMSLWLIPPTFKLLRFALLGNDVGRPDFTYVALRVAPICAVIIAVVTLLPLGPRVQSPGVIRFADAEHIHTQVDGRIEQIFVVDGQHVEEGDLLVSLSSPSLQDKLHQLRVEYEQSELKLRQLFAVRQISAYQAELLRRDSLTAEIALQEERAASLSIRAGRAGSVVAPELLSQVDRWFPKGTRLLQIGSADQKEIVASLATDDVKQFREKEDEELDFVPATCPSLMSGRLTVVEHAARFESDIRVTALAGGPLAVRDAGPHEGWKRARDLEVTLVKPRIQAIIALSPATSRQLAVGSTATILLDGRRHWTEAFRARVRTARESVLQQLNF